MKLIKAKPPNFEIIAAAIPAARQPGIAFCYGDTIFYSGNPPAADIIAHEEVHSKRQGNDPDGWWRRYIDDLRFRFEEELLAHRAEYRANDHRTINQQAQILRQITRRLAGPLYGNLVTREEAERLIFRK